ncbi:hypothetical protein ACP4OV_012089 [Aristida adscensionis]
MAAPVEALTDDLVGETLLRVPPAEPAHLVRAAAVCKPWRRLLADPAFLRRYRAFHRAPPMLGFLHNVVDSDRIPRLVPLLPAAVRFGRPMGLVVWDPLTGHQESVPLPVHPHSSCAATVLCAAAGCDHLDCRGGPHLVVFVGTDERDHVTWASVYSSETGAWSAAATVDVSASANVDHSTYVEMRPSHLIGDALYFMLELGKSFLEYDLGDGGLTLIDAPLMDELNVMPDGILMASEDGGLEFVAVDNESSDSDDLCIWSWEEDEDVAGWVLHTTIDLRALIPKCELSCALSLVGIVEGTDTVFLSSYVGLFTLEIKSRKARKVGEQGAYYAVLPYMSFFAPVHAMNDRRRLEDTTIHPLT